jgi:hypothetical protein
LKTADLPKKKFSTSAATPLRHLPAIQKKSTDSGRVHDLDTCATSIRGASNSLKRPVCYPFVDKLLNIHRIECAELPRNATANFFSSFGPPQKQGLFDRFRHT